MLSFMKGRNIADVVEFCSQQRVARHLAQHEINPLEGLIHFCWQMCS